MSTKIIEATNASGIKIYYDDDKHKYWTNNVSDFTSGTAFVHHFFPPFDEAKISAIVARRRGITVEEVLREWQISRESGTEVHYYAECLLNNWELPKLVYPASKLMAKHLDYYIPILLDNFELIETEKIVFSEKLKISGMLDVLMRRKSDGVVFILDWKTVNKMRTRSYRSRKGFGACSGIDDCNYWHYVIQLNLYRYLLTRYHGYDDIMKSSLIHISKDGVCPYPVPDKQDLIHKLIKEFTEEDK